MKANRNLVILIIFLAFLATLFLGRQIFFPQKEKLQVINTTPLPGQNNVSLNQKIILEFNQAVNHQNFTFSFFPEFPFEVKSENQKITITPAENFLPNTQYRLEIKDKMGNSFFSLIFQTAKEEIIPSPSLSVPPSPSVSPSPLPSPETNAEGRGDPNAAEEMAKRLYQEYPLYDSVPHRTATWFTDYAAPKKLLIIYKKGEDLPTIQEEVFAWIRENKVDPKTHLYVWEERETLP